MALTKWHVENGASLSNSHCFLWKEHVWQQNRTCDNRCQERNWANTIVLLHWVNRGFLRREMPTSDDDHAFWCDYSWRKTNKSTRTTNISSRSIDPNIPNASADGIPTFDRYNARYDERTFRELRTCTYRSDAHRWLTCPDRNHSSNSMRTKLTTANRRKSLERSESTARIDKNRWNVPFSDRDISVVDDRTRRNTCWKSNKYCSYIPHAFRWNGPDRNTRSVRRRTVSSRREWWISRGEWLSTGEITDRRNHHHRRHHDHVDRLSLPHRTGNWPY